MADPNDPVDITELLELKKINKDLRKVGTRPVTLDEYRESKLKIELADPKSKGELVPFEKKPSPQKGGLLPILRKLGKRLHPALGLADLAISSQPSPEELKERIEKLKGEGHDLRSGLDTIIDLVKGKNPPISRRDFLRGIGTAGQMAITPNLPIDLSEKKIETVTPTSSVSKDKIIEDSLKSLFNSNLEGVKKLTSSEHGSSLNSLGWNLFDFSTQSRSFNPDYQFDDEYEEVLFRDGVSIKDYKTSDSDEDNKWSKDFKAARKGNWEALEDTMHFYDIKKDVDGTWKEYKKIAEAFRKGTPRDKFLLRHDIREAFDWLRESEWNAETQVKVFLDNYYRDFKEVDPDVSSESKFPHTYKEPFYKKLNVQEREAWQNEGRRERDKRLRKRFPPDEDFKTGGVIRNPHSYAPRDI